MTDNFSPDDFRVPDEQMGLWDAPPPEPPDDEWIPPEPPEDAWIPPALPDEEPLPAASEVLAVDEPFAPPTALPDESEYAPSNTWERYLASFTPDQNPDIVESEQRSRARDLNLEPVMNFRKSWQRQGV